MMRLAALVCAVMALGLLVLPPARAASGDLDTTFNHTGYLTRDFAATFNSASGVVVQPDRKIVVSGSATINGGGGFLLTRHQPDGTIDKSFGTAGTATIDFGEVAEATALVRQPDGKLIVVGHAGTYRYFAVARFEADGSPDQSFGNDGAVLTAFGDPQAFAAAVALRTDGTIVVVGSTGAWEHYRFAAVRYRPDGTLDPTFGTAGKVTTDLTGDDSATAVVTQPDGSVVVGGYAGGYNGNGFALVRYLLNGTVDPTFGTDGHVITSFGPYGGAIAAVALHPDGRVLAVGSVATGADIQVGPTRIFALARYLPNGSLDPTFDRDGTVTTWINNYDQRANAVVLRPDGRFVIAGSATGVRGFVLAAYNLDGSLDRSFGVDGVVATDTDFGAPAVGGLASDPRGNLVVSGSALQLGHPVLAIARYRDEGPPPPEPPATPTTHTTAPAPRPAEPTTATTRPAPPPRSGYWMVTADGAVHGFGAAPALGHAPAVAVDLEPTPTGRGYWTLNRIGTVSAFGDAVDLGDVADGKLRNGEEAASLSATPSAEGYWVFTNRGRVFAFGDATFLGDMSAVRLNGPVLGSVATPTGKGYYMVASDGGIFTFGDAAFAGSTGGTNLIAPVRSLVPDSDGKGYWLVASDGGIFAFDAPFRGSMGATKLNKPVVGMVRYGDGYLMVGADGGIFNFSTLPFAGSLGDKPPAAPVVAVAALP
jgi:uncharacterized delta-60 repeat protein